MQPIIFPLGSRFHAGEAGHVVAATLGLGASYDFVVDEERQIVLEESMTAVRCYLYPVGAIIPVDQDGGAQQAARTLETELDRSTHAIVIEPGASTVSVVLRGE